MSRHELNDSATHDAQGTLDEQTAYDRALRELRRNTGCTWERLAESDALRHALEARVAQRAGEPTLLACVEELQETVDELSDLAYRKALLVALGLHEKHQGRTLTERRRSLNADLRLRREDVDVRTLERRENAAIQIVAARLAETPGAMARLVAPAERSGGLYHFRTESRETWYRFGPRRVLREQVVAFRQVALAADASTFHVSFNYRADPRDRVIEIEPMFGCEPAGDPHVVEGWTFRKLRTPEPVALGEVCHVMFRVRVHSDRECLPRLTTAADDSERQMVKHVEFHPDAIPEKVWSFAHLTDSGIAYNPRQSLLPAGPQRFVTQAWHDLRVGLRYGLAWDWP